MINHIRHTQKSIATDFQKVNRNNKNLLSLTYNDLNIKIKFLLKHNSLDKPVELGKAMKTFQNGKC